MQNQYKLIKIKILFLYFSEETPPPEITTLDLSNKKLKKLNKPSPDEAQASVLILDNNELQRLDNIDSFVKLQKVEVILFRF